MSSPIADAYNTIAKDFSATRNHPWGEFDEFIKYLPKNARVLDVGCGNGRLLETLVPYDIASYTGVDISKNLLIEAQKKHLNAEFIHDDMRTLSTIKNRQFDAIFCIASFHHLPDDQDRIQTLQTLQTLLAPQGIICMTNWNLFQKKYIPYINQGFWRWIKGKNQSWNDTLIPFTGSNGKTDRYYHAFTPPELKKLFDKTGLTIIDFFAYNKNKRVSPWWKGRNMCHVLRQP